MQRRRRAKIRALGIPVLYPENSAEYVNSFDTLRLLMLLWHYFGTNHWKGNWQA